MCRRANDEPEYAQPTIISTLVVVHDYVRLYVPAATDLNALVICGYGASQADLMEFMTQYRPRRRLGSRDFHWSCRSAASWTNGASRSGRYSNGQSLRRVRISFDMNLKPCVRVYQAENTCISRRNYRLHVLGFIALGTMNVFVSYTF